MPTRLKGNHRNGQTEHAAGDLSVVVATDHRGDEVGVLARTFNRMTDSLKEMAGVAGKIAGGDLRTTVKPQSSTDVLGNAFARMTENLREQTRQLVEGANVLGSSGRRDCGFDLRNWPPAPASRAAAVSAGDHDGGGSPADGPSRQSESQIGFRQRTKGGAVFPKRAQVHR